MIRVLELFAGIGACSKALENLNIPHEIVDAVEIDKYAVKSFNAIHHTSFEPQDITKWDKDIDVDLIMHGSPCQDFSIAGKQLGGDKDSHTRSSLMYETLRIVEKLKPKYVIWENVKNLLSNRHRHNFDAYIQAMDQLGYHSTYQVLNAKDYGVPQNRERVFTVSVRNDINQQFIFPPKQELKIKLKDLLENEVDEKYYLTNEQVASFTAQTNRAQARGSGFKFSPTDGDGVAHTVSTKAGQRKTDNFVRCIGRVEAINGHDILKRVYSAQGISPTLSTMGGGNTEPKIIEDEPIVVASRGRGEKNEQHLEPRKDGVTNTITSVAKDNFVAIKTGNKQGYDLATDGDGVDFQYPNSNTRRGRVGHGVAKTIATNGQMGVVESYRIRKLTPKECWRLMGFDDESFERAAKVNSNHQLHKQAGNSIVVNVLEAILTRLFEGESDY